MYFTFTLEFMSKALPAELITPRMGLVKAYQAPLRQSVANYGQLILSRFRQISNAIGGVRDWIGRDRHLKHESD